MLQRVTHPLISFGLSRDEHFAQVQGLADPGCFSLDAKPTCGSDLRFAARRTVEGGMQLEAMCEEDIACVEELAERLRPFDMCLHAQQSAQVRSVAGRFDVALVAVLVIIGACPDFKLPLRMITGFRSISLIEASGVFRRVQVQQPPSKAEWLAQSARSIGRCERCIPDEEDARFMKECCLQDEQNLL